MDHGDYVLISAYDKTDLVEFCRQLAAEGLKLLSTGGSARVLQEAGLEVMLIEELTGMGPVLDHKVVTLQAKIYMGLLADLNNPEHLAELAEHGAIPIHMVIGGFYPFGIDPADFEHGGQITDQIDIGGPCLARAAVKGGRLVVIDPTDYDQVLTNLLTYADVPEDLRRHLYRRVFTATSELDGNIAKLFED